MKKLEQQIFERFLDASDWSEAEEELAKLSFAVEELQTYVSLQRRAEQAKEGLRKKIAKMNPRGEREDEKSTIQLVALPMYEVRCESPPKRGIHFLKDIRDNIRYELSGGKVTLLAAKVFIDGKTRWLVSEEQANILERISQKAEHQGSAFTFVNLD